jgi:hypothetical protein
MVVGSLTRNLDLATDIRCPNDKGKRFLGYYAGTH